MDLLEETLSRIRPVDRSWIDKAAARQLELTKPPGSLGRLEDIANRCAAISETLSPRVSRALIAVFAGDHGVCEEGVSPYPQAVTAQMVLNFLRGGAAINALTRANGIELKVVDVGVAGELPEAPGLVRRRVACGTRNFCKGSAMSAEEARAALAVGIDVARQAAADGFELLGFGEMGIGNTTASTAIAAALSGLPPASLVGRGAGADDRVLARKTAAIERGLALHRGRLDHPFDVLARVGGLEIAAMCGFCLRGAAERRPVAVDGVIAASAAALAVRMKPEAAGYLFASHRSAEPAQTALLQILGQEPLLDLRMRLGEGTGAAIAIKIIQAAVAAFTGMATFASAGVSTNRTPVLQR